MSFYIGISGVRNVADVTTLHHLGAKEIFTDKNIFLGFSTHLISEFSLYGKAEKILSPFSSLTGVLHHNVKSLFLVKEKIQFLGQLPQWFEYIQLNDLQKDCLSIIHLVSQRFKVILSVNQKNTKILFDQNLVKKLQELKTEILVDLSGGQGKYIEPQVYLPILQQIKNLGFSDLGVAGGLGPDCLQSFFVLQQAMGLPLSLDAESGLKTQGRLDSTKVTQYLQQVSLGLKLKP